MRLRMKGWTPYIEVCSSEIPRCRWMLKHTLQFPMRRVFFNCAIKENVYHYQVTLSPVMLCILCIIASTCLVVHDYLKTYWLAIPVGMAVAIAYTIAAYYASLLISRMLSNDQK